MPIFEVCCCWQILEHSLLLDVNVHKQARRDLDKIITKEIDEKCTVNAPSSAAWIN